MARQLDDLDRKIIVLRQAGMSDQRIADQFGVSYGMIFHRRRALVRDGRLAPAGREQTRTVASRARAFLRRLLRVQR